MVYSRLLLRFAFILLCANMAQGQGFRKIYTIDGSQFRDVVETADGSFFLAGVSGQHSALFQLTDHVGNTIWSYSHDFSGAEPLAACQANDGGFVVLAEHFDDGSGPSRNLVIKISPSGTVQWQTPVANANMENGCADLAALPDGGVVLVGSVRTDFFNQNIKLLKINAEGAPDWSSELGSPTHDEFAVRLLADADGGFTVGGFGTYGAAGEGIADFFLAKTDASGTLLWLKNYPKPATQLALDLLRATDGGIVLLGETQQHDPNQVALLKTDAAGNEQWFTAFHPSPQGPESSPLLVFNAMAQDNVGQLHVPILLYDFLAQSDVDSSFLVSLSPSGQVVATRGFYQEDETRQIIHTQDDKLVLAGSVGLKTSPTTSAYLSKVDLMGKLYGNVILGALFHDLNDDCTQQPNESPLPNFSVRAKNAAGDEFFTQTDTAGTYSLLVSEGNFDLTAEPLLGAAENWGACDTPAVSVMGQDVTVAAPAIGIRSLSNCPQMEVELGAGILRRCFTARFILNYCNAGAAEATGVYALLTADPNLEFLTSSLPLTAQVGQEFRFDLGAVTPGQCGAFTADFKVGCNTPLGAVLCMDAHIFPDSICPPPSVTNWDGSRLVAKGECDGEVKFTLKNVGPSNMSELAEYVIIEDQIIFMQSAVQLDAGEDTVITIVGTPNGKSYHLSTEQVKGYPGNSYPSATVQGCGGSGGENLLLQLSQDQGDYLATYCAEVRGSFDPNDKQGFPEGWQEQHLIERNRPLDYLIRFQNTGNDTAFLVVVRDTLSALLAAGTVRPGPSSHPYTFDLSEGGVLTFRFSNILLPDSNVNEVASHGYVRFRVEQQPNLPLGSRIENRAAIYFDFNEAVITNTVFHTIGERLLSFSVDHPADLVGLRIEPNPMADEAIFRLQTPISGADLRLSLFDATGRIVRDEAFAQPEHRFLRRGLLPGMYFFAVKKDGAVVASGKVVAR